MFLSHALSKCAARARVGGVSDR